MAPPGRDTACQRLALRSRFVDAPDPRYDEEGAVLVHDQNLVPPRDHGSMLTAPRLAPPEQSTVARSQTEELPPSKVGEADDLPRGDDG